MILRPDDREQSQVIAKVARDIKIPDCEFYMAFELFDMIKDLNPPVFQKLEAFLDAHNKWWAFQEEHEAELSANGLLPQNFSRNMDLMKARDDSRPHTYRSSA